VHLALEVRSAATNRPKAVFFAVLTMAISVVFVIWLLTNHMTPQWDMAYYLDMATRGLIGNKNLAAPFAYRPAAPLIVGVIAHVFRSDPETMFRVSDAIMCVVFILSCFYFARSLGASVYAAAFAGLALALNFNVVKWTLFSGTMVDIYAYPFLLAAFWALLRKRFYLCLAISAVGLFFKEFLLVPIMVQAAVVVFRGRFKEWRTSLNAVMLTILVLLLCFVLPRLAIHVARTFQDIDPLNDGSTISRLITYPLSRRHDFNILFAFLAGWLPVLLLLDRRRLRMVWLRLYPYRVILVLFTAFHFFLVMYGGTNINIYITYCAPIQIMVLIVLLDKGNTRTWEACLAIVAVFVFNRLWKAVPLPQNGMDTYLDFYGGYYMRVTPSSFFRMGEVLAYILSFGVLRSIISHASKPRASAGSELASVPTSVA